MMLFLIFGLFILLFLTSLFVRIKNKKILLIFTIGLSIGFIMMLFLSIHGLMDGNGISKFILFDSSPLIKISNLESLFLLIFSIVGLSVSFYTQWYWGELFKKQNKINYYVISLILFILSMLGVIVANEALFFLVCWEVMSISSYFLVIHKFHEKKSVKNANLYLIITHIGMFSILLSFLPFIQNSASTFFDTWNAIGIHTPVLNSMFFLALLGFGSKAGLVPMHIRLPKAHPIAPSNISALMSGFMVKLPVLMIIKYLFWVQDVHFSWVLVVLFIASISGFIGIFFALIQHNIKKMLANSTIENIGIIFIGIAIFMFGMYLKNNAIIFLGILASLYHVFNHAMFKTLLFLSSGGIHARTGTYEYTRLGGLLKFTPFLGFIFLFGAIAISGIPPFNGFNSEVITYIGLIKSTINHIGLLDGLLFVLSLLLLSLTAIFSLIGFMKLFAITFLGNKRDEKINYTKIKSYYEKIGYGILVLACISLSLFPGVIQNIVLSILGEEGATSLTILNLDNLYYQPILFRISITIIVSGGFFLLKKIYKKQKSRVRNCGYDYISPKTQYTSTSLIQPIRKIYAELYASITILNHKNIGKATDKYYKKHFSHIEYSNLQKDIFNILYMKIKKSMNKLSMLFKSIQNGKMEFYVIYILITLITVILIIML